MICQLTLAVEQGTKEGDRIRKLMCDGAIIPYETVVHTLMRTLRENKSDKYVIDGFPRAVDQAHYFEQSVCEIQQILHFDIPQETMIKRLNDRTRLSKRIDDNFDIIKKRISNFNDQTLPVFDYYRTFGKIRTIDASKDESEVQSMTMNALLP
jgi:adenylate kinase family enzyme